MSVTDSVKIFDTTLRDGEQAPGFSMSLDGKLRVAKSLANLNVDVIEAGFAAASPGDAAIISRICEEIEGPTICSLARAVKSDIAAAAEALKNAPKRRIHLFIGTSPLHREAKLQMSRDEVLAKIREMVAYAKSLTDDVEFSAEDAIRTERDFLVEALSVATAEGANVLNVPDTVGYTTPGEIKSLFEHLVRHVDRPDHVIFSAHCHDDLGLAVANSLAAVEGGARQVECTINAVGERAGNCALEEVVMAINTRRDHYQCQTSIHTQGLMQASRALAQATNSHVPRNKAVVGINAFAHESGIHQHGVLANRETYEIMRAEDVGQEAAHLVLGKHSGRHALKARAKHLGYDLGDNQLQEAFVQFKALADEIGIVHDARLCSLFDELVADQPADLWQLGHLNLRSKRSPDGQPVAEVELLNDAQGAVSQVAIGHGELDASFSAIASIMDIEAHVDDLDLQYIAAECDESASDKQSAEVLVEISVLVAGERYAGRAVGRDVVPVCVTAFIDALNNAKTLQARLGQNSQTPHNQTVSQ